MNRVILITRGSMDYGFTDLTDSKSIKSVIYGFGKFLRAIPKSINYEFYMDLENYNVRILD